MRVFRSEMKRMRSEHVGSFLFAAAFSLLCVVPAHAKDVIHLPVPYLAQPDDQTCLPTSLNMLLHYMGREVLTTDTIQRLHKRTQYDRYNLPDIVKDYGLYAFPSWLEYGWTKETIETELRLGRPVIMGLDVGRYGHFVLAIGYTDDGKIIVNDPSSGVTRDFGGPHSVADWSMLNWRNGIIIRPEPFPEAPVPVSGTMETITYPTRITSGDTTAVTVLVKNNGRVPWPDGVVLAPVDAYSSPTQARESRFAVVAGDQNTSGAWKSASRIAEPSIKNLPPGQTAEFTFLIRGPELTTSELFRENFNLVEPSGRWFSSHWQSGPSNRQIHMRIAVDPRRSWSFPLAETGSGNQLSLPWQTKRGSLEPVPPSVAGTSVPENLTAFRLISSEHKSSMAWVGPPDGRDYKVESWVYCDYRPQDKPSGYDRVGLVIHDNGHHAGPNKGEVEVGACLAMTYDSDDGKLRAGNVFNGALLDFRPAKTPHKITASGWHKFAITCRGSKVIYELDGLPFHEADIAEDSELLAALASGDCGFFYLSTFKEPTLRHGTCFAGFKATQP